jgi:hypothetical protein
MLLRANAKSMRQAVLACAVGLAMTCAWTPARAGDDDETAPDIKFLQGVLEGIGLQSGREKSINYHERSPLVIPPSNALLPPETDAATKNPNWPVDPEVTREKKLRQAERNRAPGSSSEQFNIDARPVPASVMTSGPKRNSPRDAPGLSEDESARPLSAQQLGNKKSLFSNFFGSKDDGKSAQFVGEPARASLTDPPAGYQTPSPNQVYGEAKEVYRPKAIDSYTSHGTNIGK